MKMIMDDWSMQQSNMGSGSLSYKSGRKDGGFVVVIKIVVVMHIIWLSPLPISPSVKINVGESKNAYTVVCSDTDSQSLESKI